ncbi:MAG TPA: RNA methyltransferase, partial [Thermoanaerobaculia bacterium]|nr:RNA methyltransferase [Thermoanaerobaculia bacterium]
MRQARRCKGDEALLEGPHLVREAAAARLRFVELVATPDLAESAEGRELLAALPFPPELAEAEVLATVFDADSPRGIAAVVELPRPGVDGLPVVADGVYLYLDGLQDPGNLGALVRSAEAAGIAGVALGPGCAHPNHPRALRASAGSLLRVDVARNVEAADLTARLEEVNARWAALATRGGDPLWQADLGGALVLALGAEGPGLSEQIESRCHLHLTIPLQSPVES